MVQFQALGYEIIILSNKRSTLNNHKTKVVGRFRRGKNLKNATGVRVNNMNNNINAITIQIKVLFFSTNLEDLHVPVMFQ